MYYFIGKSNVCEQIKKVKFYQIIMVKKMNDLKYDYDNIMSLAKKHNFKKIMIMRNS